MLQIIVYSAGRQAACARSARRPRPGSATSSSRQGRCLARSGTCEPAAAGPDTLATSIPERLRFPACATAPGRPETISGYEPVARPIRRRSCPPLLRGCRRDRGSFVARPPRAQGGDKTGPLLPIITSQSRGVAGRNADPGVAGAWIQCVVRGAARKSPTVRGSRLRRRYRAAGCGSRELAAWHRVR